MLAAVRYVTLITANKLEIAPTQNHLFLPKSRPQGFPSFSTKLNTWVFYSTIITGDLNIPYESKCTEPGLL